MAWCQGSREKRFAGRLRSMAVMFARESDQSTYCCQLPLMMLLSLAVMCTALPLTARADSATQNIVSSTIIDASCKISLTPIDYPLNGAVPRRRSEVAATCGRYSYLAASSMAVGSNGETGTHSKLIGYALPVTIAPRDGHLASVLVSNPGDRIVHLNGDVREWHQDVFGQDVFVASSAAFISPKRVKIEPGATREFIVRLPATAEHELAFHIVLQQISGDTNIQAGHPVSTITQSLPAFSEPAQRQEAILRARRIDPQHLLITNDGGRRARLVAIRSNGQIVASGLVGYALAHSSVLVPLNSAAIGRTVDIVTDRGHSLVEIR
jgi:hypothetical protein